MSAPDPKRPGRSYAGFLRGQTPRWRNRLYFEYSNVRGLLTENLKLIQRTKAFPSEFYDLEADPGETKNVYNDPGHQGQVSDLRTDLESFFRKSGAPELEDWRRTTQQDLTKYKSEAFPELGPPDR